MKRLPALALSAATALAVLAPLPAQADTYSSRDAVGDVVMSEGESAEETPAPERTDGDVTATRITHAKRAVSVTMQFADLTRDSDFVAHVYELRTNERLKRDLMVFAGEGMWRGQAQLTRPSGQPVRCKVRSSIDYTRNTVAVSVPRSCLSNPRWVQVGLGSVSVKGEAGYADDALATGPLGDSPKLSPRIRR